MECNLFIGRFQPIHKGHYSNISSDFDKIFCIIDNENSYKDISKNPFSLKYRTKLIKKLFPNSIIIINNDSYIPNIISNDIFKKYNRINIICGNDRVEDYKRLIKGLDNVYLKLIDYNHEEYCSTNVRNSLKNNDYEEFKKLMPESLYSEFDYMKNNSSKYK